MLVVVIREEIASRLRVGTVVNLVELYPPPTDHSMCVVDVSRVKLWNSPWIFNDIILPLQTPIYIDSRGC